MLKGVQSDGAQDTVGEKGGGKHVEGNNQSAASQQRVNCKTQRWPIRFRTSERSLVSTSSQGRRLHNFPSLYMFPFVLSGVGMRAAVSSGRSIPCFDGLAK